jgi:hypothetical protein
MCVCVRCVCIVVPGGGALRIERSAQDHVASAGRGVALRVRGESSYVCTYRSLMARPELLRASMEGYRRRTEPRVQATLSAPRLQHLRHPLLRS